MYRKLNNNNIEGLLSSEISKLRSLVYIDLSSNKFNGRLPSFAFATLLVTLLVSDNNFTGPMPLSLNSQSYLTRIEAHNNQFTQVIFLFLFMFMYAFLPILCFLCSFYSFNNIGEYIDCNSVWDFFDL